MTGRERVEREGVGLEGLIPGIVDAHVHYFNPSRPSWALDRFERLPMKRFVPPPVHWIAAKLGAGGDNGLGLDPSLLRAPYEPTNYARDASVLPAVAGVGVAAVVAVEANWRTVKPPEALMETSFDELKYLLDLPHGRGPELGAVVIAADPRHPQFAAELDRQLALSDKVRAIRFKWARHPDPDIHDWCDEPDAVASTSFLRGFEALAERDLAFVSLAYSHQLGQLDMLARRFPEVTMVVEHLGVPAGVFGPTGARTGMTAAARAEILGLWRERMAMIAQRPNVVAKVSGLGLPYLGYGPETSGNIGTRAVLADMMGPLVMHVVEHFGPDRVIFGSDSPIDRPNSPIEMTVGALLDVLEPRGSYLMQQLFADNARRIYGIHPD